MAGNPILSELSARYPQLVPIIPRIDEAAAIIISCYASGGKLLVCGNGGSSSDADHLVGELMKSFELNRPVKKDYTDKLVKLFGDRGSYIAQKLEGALPAISLSSHTSLTTSISNDIGADMVFAQQVSGYGSEIDILMAISTSGNSLNIINACITARVMNMKVIGLSGKTGGKMKEYCDILINVPVTSTALIQEMHLPVLHALCRLIENHFYGIKKSDE